MKLHILLSPGREAVAEITIAETNGPTRNPTLYEITEIIRCLNQSISINDTSRCSVTTNSRLDEIEY